MFEPVERWEDEVKKSAINFSAATVYDVKAQPSENVKRMLRVSVETQFSNKRRTTRVEGIKITLRITARKRGTTAPKPVLPL